MIPYRLENGGLIYGPGEPTAADRLRDRHRLRPDWPMIIACTVIVLTGPALILALAIFGRGK